jgi:putative endonuclease
MYYVYIIKDDTGKIYRGYTADLKRRIKEHQQGRGGEYTKRWKKITLVYYEAYRSKEDAIERTKIKTTQKELCPIKKENSEKFK